MLKNIKTNGEECDDLMLKVVQLILSNTSTNIELAISLVRSQRLNFEYILDLWEKAFIENIYQLYCDIISSGDDKTININLNLLGNVLEVEIDIQTYLEDNILDFTDYTFIKVYYTDDGEQLLDSHKTVEDYDHDFYKMLHGICIWSFKRGVMESFSEHPNI